MKRALIIVVVAASLLTLGAADLAAAVRPGPAAQPGPLTPARQFGFRVAHQSNLITLLPAPQAVVNGSFTMTTITCAECGDGCPGSGLTHTVEVILQATAAVPAGYGVSSLWTSNYTVTNVAQSTSAALSEGQQVTITIAGDVVVCDSQFQVFFDMCDLPPGDPTEACGEAPSPTLTVTLPGGVPLELLLVPAGVFQMGSPVGERGRLDQEDLHEVTLTQAYYVGKYEVTQGQWAAVMGSWSNTCGSNGVGAGYPVYCVSWNDIAGAGGFVETINAYLTSTGQVTGFRLPTEAEWERAARAGTQTRFSHGDVLECDDYAGACPAHDVYMWWGGSQPYTSAAHPAGSRQANWYGLYDMHGNEFEWVQDRYQKYLGTSPVTDPTGPGTGSYRVVRGGGWFYGAQGCRSASRYEDDSTSRFFGYGFRLARTAG